MWHSSGEQQTGFLLVLILAVGAIAGIGWVLPAYKVQTVKFQLPANCVITSPNGSGSATESNVGVAITPKNGHEHITATLNINNNITGALDVIRIIRGTTSSVSACNTASLPTAGKLISFAKVESTIDQSSTIIFDQIQSIVGQDNTVVVGTTYIYQIDVQIDIGISGIVDKPTFLGSPANPFCTIEVIDS